MLRSNHVESINLSESHLNKSPSCTVLKSMRLQFDHYQAQNFKQKLMLLTNFVSNRQKHTEDRFGTLCNYTVTRTAQFTRNLMGIHVYKLNCTEIS